MPIDVKCEATVGPDSSFSIHSYKVYKLLLEVHAIEAQQGDIACHYIVMSF